MEQKTLDQLVQIALVTPVATPLRRRDKLRLWAAQIDEWQSPHYERVYLDGLRSVENSTLSELRCRRLPDALAIAAASPKLQAAGLTAATVGEFMDFFDLSQMQLHRIACYCQVDMSCRAVARRIRSVARFGIIARFATFFF